MKTYSKEEAISLEKKKLCTAIEENIANKENIQNIIVDTIEQEKYIEVFVTYEVLENIERYEKLEI